MLLSIVFFFVCMWGLGFSVIKIAKVRESSSILESSVMQLGVGLGIFPILAVILAFFKIPLDWKYFLLLSLIYPIFFITKKFKLNNKFKFNIKNIKMLPQKDSEKLLTVCTAMTYKFIEKPPEKKVDKKKKKKR